MEQPAVSGLPRWPAMSMPSRSVSLAAQTAGTSNSKRLMGCPYPAFHVHR